MGGGFLFLIAGGLIGYQFGKDRSDPAHRGFNASWHERWHENRRQACAAKEALLAQLNTEKSGLPAAPTQEASASPPATKSWFGGIDASEWKAFQDWRAQQQRPPQAASPQQTVYNKELLRETAVEGADKALDALLVQVSNLKERLGHYKSTPGTPATEVGDFKLV